MPTTLNSVSISSLKQFSNFLEKQLPASKDSILWFRGSGRASYPLSPSLHRHATIDKGEEIIELEIALVDRFKQRSVPFLKNSLDKKNDWEVLFFMQHYGIPTRLLDWTENPFVSMYFALTSAPYQIISKKRVYSDDCCIWVLDPVMWNQESLKDFSYNQGILSVENHLVDSYRPRTPFANIREKPIAIFGTHNSPRIVAQRGVFVVFGKNLSALDETYRNDSFPQECLTKIIFPKKKIESLLHSLTSIGITDSVIYPDLEGFSKELKRFYKFDL
ncbi:FRG domain-containing protein [Pedobacter changchengzhani]|uniref:FRG domain-containing protein n=1 Tax=Pedobacter changchengzhani TaxID=2529274 RepID=A0A4V2ZZY0_9SPHI|nr:FRG domain-containing protein [Pedobacter changchengzhani]TDG34823.1 FRG domain-containing protein [Pedobacter changchengzhani]